MKTFSQAEACATRLIAGGPDFSLCFKRAMAETFQSEAEASAAS
jgi:hypothetical protein